MPGQWTLGQISDLHPGTGGVIRVVTLKTHEGLVKRPVYLLARLALRSPRRMVKYPFELTLNKLF